MTRWLLSLWAWRLVRHTGVNAYFENAVTGEREVLWCGVGHQPIEHDWLTGGEFQDCPPATGFPAVSASRRPREERRC